MFLAYCDESGDIGIKNSPSRYFCLSGIIIHEHSWRQMLDELIAFRRHLKNKYGLLMKEEIHAAEFVNGRVSLKNNITRYERLRILIECMEFLNSRNYISIITLRCDKSIRTSPDDVYERAWKYFLQRIENTTKHNNFKSPNNHDRTIIIPDMGDVARLKTIVRKMRRHNPVNNKLIYGAGITMLNVEYIIKDPIFRDSKESYFHQMVDVVVYFARQHFECNSWLKKRGARNTYITKLNSVTNPFATRDKTKNYIVQV